jgi:hypothetical protein
VMTLKPRGERRDVAAVSPPEARRRRSQV